MNNEQLDECIHSALKSEAPYTLKQSLAVKMRLAENQKKQRHMFPLKRASAAAVVLICAMGIMKLDKTAVPERPTAEQKEATSGRAALDENVQIRAAVTDEALQTETETENGSTVPQSTAAKNENAKEAKEAQETTSPVSADGEAIATADSAESVNADAVFEPAQTETENTTSEEYAAVLSLQDTEETFSHGGSGASLARGRTRQRLEDLFAAGYDYRAAIYEAILPLLSEAKIYNLTEITGDEAFEYTEDGELTLIFPEGSIAPPEYGQIRLYAGKTENGILIK